MKQRWLPEFDNPDVDERRPQPASEDVGDEPLESFSVPVVPGQWQLFTAERDLIGQIEDALADGRFEDAGRHRDALVALEGPSMATRELAALDVVGERAFWQRPLSVVLADWLELDRGLGAVPHVRRLIRDGGLSRLLDRHEPHDLVRAAPAVLAPLANLLCAAGVDGDPIPADAAALVRDALLNGCAPAPGDFDDDRLVDLLAEDGTSSWLACLGALRQLWPVLPADPSGLTTACPPISEDEDERGRQFWMCLQCVVACGRDEPAAIAARKRMKQLHPDLHALFMRHGVRRE